MGHDEMDDIPLIIIPDEDDEDAAEIFVDGKIGQKKYRFLLDTGAAKTHVQLDAFTSSFDSTQTSNSAGVFAHSNYELITVPSIEVGSIVKENVTIARYTENSPNLRNLIGMDFLKDFRCQFFFDKPRVVIDAPESPLAATDQCLELFLGNKFHPYVPIYFGDVEGNAVWDTGAGITVVDTGFIKNNPALFRKKGTSVGTDSSGTQMETSMFTMTACIIGNKQFPPHPVAGVDLSYVNSTTEVPMDMILGYSTLSKANWLFDFPHKKWKVIELLHLL
jgi:predicted aspartyl protease